MSHRSNEAEKHAFLCLPLDLNLKNFLIKQAKLLVVYLIMCIAHSISTRSL